VGQQRMDSTCRLPAPGDAGRQALSNMNRKRWIIIASIFLVFVGSVILAMYIAAGVFFNGDACYMIATEVSGLDDRDSPDALQKVALMLIHASVINAKIIDNTACDWFGRPFVLQVDADRVTCKTRPLLFGLGASVHIEPVKAPRRVKVLPPN
jgi:hypothetical protein